MSNTAEPSFDILRSAVLETTFDLLNSETFEPEEENEQLGEYITGYLDEIDVSNKNIQRVSIGCGTDWIKCACGTVNIGIRLEQESSTSNDGNQSKETKKQKGNNSSNTKTLSMFGGSDGDRSNAGDRTFWEIIQKKAPSITAEQWTEFCTGSSTPGLVVTLQEPDEDEEDEDEDGDWGPHAKFPDVIHSTIILTLAEKILGSAVITTEEESPWKYEGPSDAIECDGNKLEGHTWIRQQL